MQQKSLARCNAGRIQKTVQTLGGIGAVISRSMSGIYVTLPYLQRSTFVGHQPRSRRKTVHAPAAREKLGGLPRTLAGNPGLRVRLQTPQSSVDQALATQATQHNRGEADSSRDEERRRGVRAGAPESIVQA